MTTEDIKTKEDELKRKSLNYVMSIAEEFPGARIEMDEAIPCIEADLANGLSRHIIPHIISHLNSAMEGEEIAGLSIEEMDLLTDAVYEHDAILRENKEENKGALADAKKLKKILDLEFRKATTFKDAIKIRDELLVQWQKADSMDPLGEVDDQWISDMKGLIERTSKMLNETKEIFHEVASDASLYGISEVEVAINILTSKIKRLNRISVSYKDVEENKRAQALLAKLKKVSHIRRKEQEWKEIELELREFLSIIGDDPFSPMDMVGMMDLGAGIPSIVGMIVIKKMNKT
ncbi:MAG: hypothetical protein WA063_00470 [Minisyncoccia bacterium]